MKEKDRVYWLGVTATFFAFTFAVILLLSSILGFYCLILFFGTLIVLSNRKIEKQKDKGEASFTDESKISIN